MSIWKRHIAALAALSAATTVINTEVLADISWAAPIRSEIVRPTLPAHVLKPEMLAPPAASHLIGSQLISVKGSKVRISKEQMDAYASLSPDLKSKLGPPVGGSVLGAKELGDLRNKAYSTVMCPW